MPCGFLLYPIPTVHQETERSGLESVSEQAYVQYSTAQNSTDRAMMMMMAQGNASQPYMHSAAPALAVAGGRDSVEFVGLGV